MVVIKQGFTDTIPQTWININFYNAILDVNSRKSHKWKVNDTSKGVLLVFWKNVVNP